MKEEIYYKVDDITQTIHTAFLSLHAGMALSAYYKFNIPEVKNGLKDIKIDKYLLPQNVQIYALENKSIERFVVSSSMRSVFSAMYEGLKNNEEFRDEIKAKLVKEYENFFALINLFRNLYSHEFTWINYGTIVVKPKDIQGIINYRKKEKLSTLLSINILYKEIFNSALPSPRNYGFKFSLNLENLAEGVKLTDIISIYNQIMLAEFCHNLCNGIRL